MDVKHEHARSLCLRRLYTLVRTRLTELTAFPRPPRTLRNIADGDIGRLLSFVSLGPRVAVGGGGARLSPAVEDYTGGAS